MNQDISQQLQQQIAAAAASVEPIKIVGGNSKQFLGRGTEGEALNVAEHSGIINYEPVELVVTARAGTRLSELEATLSAQGQMLPFEPPSFGESATLGGTIACGLSGSRRPYAGSARDYVLGVKMINGRGEILRFGGEVMKNVAGYDISRLMTGAMGTLGLLLEVSLKVLPKPASEITLIQQRSREEAIKVMNEWAGKSLPLSAACHDGDKMLIRLSGSAAGLQSALQRIGGEVLDGGDNYWRRLREQQLPFFEGATPLWRVSVPPATAALDLPGKCFTDWGGAQRWLKSNEPAEVIRHVATHAGGDATLFRAGDGTGDVFQPLPDNLMALHLKLKQAFDPKGIFNPGRMYPVL